MRKVSIIVPCRNEVGHIDSFLESIIVQTPPDGFEMQIVIADGMSNDGTRERLNQWSSRPDLVVVDNPKGITSSGLNLAIDRAEGEVIVRMDVHTTYAPDYVKECVRTLQETGATCVGGPWRPLVGTGLQAAIARAFESRIGSGGAASRRVDYSGPVDTVYLGAWRRDELLRLGGFDEHLVRNQDDELNLRILRSGGTVWQSASIQSSYAPRASFMALFRQFFQYGYWKVPVIIKHQMPASPRHVMPFLFVFALSAALLLAPFSRWAQVAGAAIVLAYSIVVFASAISVRAGSSSTKVGLAICCMHFGYGLGFGRGLLDFVVRRRGPHSSMFRLTR